MKLKFKIQDYQTHAVRCVVDLFRGQEQNNATFGLQNKAHTIFNDYGVGNSLMLDNNTIQDNMNAV